ncbi:MAG TPA: tetratricopeptide repeat protein [Xanthomonadaceae bacterium]|jgi:serine/threonine-protein kinase
MTGRPSFLAELKRRNVLRAAMLYVGAAWALSQGVAQLLPVFDFPNWVVRWFVIAAAIGFPFAMLFSWFYEWTPQGIQRESEVAPDASVTRETGKTMDRWIIAVLSLAVVLLLTDRFVLHKDGGAALDKSVAVLPLVNESGDPQQDYFSDGLSEELISAIAQVHDIKVIGRNSSFRFRGRQQDDTAAIGAKLGVATLLEGTVRKQGNQVRIVASLVKASDGSELWSQTYDRDLKDVFAVQSEIATSVAGALKTTLLGKAIESADKPPGGNIDAYNALLQGRYFAERRNRADYLKAVDYFQQAITLDPHYALAYARLAIAEQWFVDWAIDAGDERAATRVLARANARRAVELDPQLALAQAALGITQAWSDLDVQAGYASLKKAIALDPDNAEIIYLMADVTSCLGRFDESIAMMRKALAQDRLNPTFHFYLAQYLAASGRLDEAEAEVRRAMDLQPGAVGHDYILGQIQITGGHADRALATAQAMPDGVRRRELRALAYWLKGDHAASDAALADMERLDATTWPDGIGMVYAYRGDTDKAFEWYERGFANEDASLTEIYERLVVVPSLRNDPRLATLAKKLGLPDPATVAITAAAPKPGAAP